MANICNTTYVVQGPRKALFEVQHVFNGFKCKDRIFANHPATMDDAFLWMKFDAKKGLVIETVSKYVTHEFEMIDYIRNINEDVEVAFMTVEFNTDVWYKYDLNGVFDNCQDVFILEYNRDIPDDKLPEVLKRARESSAGYFYCYKKDIEGVDIPGTMHVIVCEDITEVSIDSTVKFAMEYSDVTRLKGVKDVHVDCARNAILMHIICDNGDVIQLVHEFGSRTILATLVGLHCSNNAHIPVCGDEIARKDLIDNLMSEISYPVLSSDPRSCYMGSPEYAFQHRGHVVYYLTCVNMDIQIIQRSFRRIVEDVLHMHKDGILLDLADMREARVSREVTKEWALT